MKLTSEVMMPTSRETKDHLLCSACEQSLNREGENWVLPRLATMSRSFPFYSLLASQEPLFAEPDIAAYAVASNPTIDRDKLIRFGIGIFWKASVHSWKGGSSKPKIDLGPESEVLRRFLRSKGDFPGNMALNLCVIPPPVTVTAFSDPVRGSDPDFKSFYFYVPGMFFWLWVDHLQPPIVDRCLIANPQGPVVVQDMTEDLMELLKTCAKTARKNQKMLEMIAKRERDGTRRFKL